MKSYEEESWRGENTAKADRRRRMSIAERRRYLEELEESRLPLKAFAAQNGINYYTLIGWRQARRREAGLLRVAEAGREAKAGLLEMAELPPSCEQAKAGPRFTEVCLGDAAPPSACVHAAMPALLQALPQGGGVVLPKPGANKSDLAQRLAQARATAPATTHPPRPLEVTLRGGAVVRGADMAQLAELLQLLGN